MPLIDLCFIGTAEDLSAYKNYLRIALPNENFAFLLSESNQTETWSDFNNVSFVYFDSRSMYAYESMYV